MVVLLLFGNRLPMVMRSLGRSVNEFKRGVGDTDEDDDRLDEQRKVGKAARTRNHLGEPGALEFGEPGASTIYPKQFSFFDDFK